MNGADRLRLTEILNQFRRVDEALRATAKARSHDELLGRAIGSLEATYQLRLYTAFENILALRAEGGGIANYVQYEIGETKTFDPATPEVVSATITWWSLLSRDRNHLAHGESRPPALSISQTLRVMESYLSMRTARTP